MSSVSLLSPPLFRDRPRNVQVVSAGVIPAGIGALAGVLLGVSSGAYWLIALLAAAGSVLAGFEHSTVGEGAKRGAVAGVIYGVALLLAHAIAGTHAKVSLGSAPVLLVVITGIAGAGLTAAGAAIRSRQAGAATGS